MQKYRVEAGRQVFSLGIVRLEAMGFEVLVQVRISRRTRYTAACWSGLPGFGL